MPSGVQAQKPAPTALTFTRGAGGAASVPSDAAAGGGSATGAGGAATGAGSAAGSRIGGGGSGTGTVDAGAGAAPSTAGGGGAEGTGGAAFWGPTGSAAGSGASAAPRLASASGAGASCCPSAVMFLSAKKSQRGRCALTPGPRQPSSSTPCSRNTSRQRLQPGAILSRLRHASRCTAKDRKAVQGCCCGYLKKADTGGCQPPSPRCC